MPDSSPAEGAAEVTVVIPARNAQATIGATLAALAAQEGVSSGVEVIVVDSGSRDETPSLVTASPVVSQLLRNPGGEPAGSRNLGARAGHSPVLAFTDADCEPAADWLASGLAALRDADIVQGRVVPARPPGPFDRTVSVSAENGLYETANLFVRRSAFDAVGGFEPVLELAPDEAPFGEDAWFVWRARRAGAAVAFAADCVVEHAVFPRDPRGFIAERARCRYFPPLVARIPELRDTFLRHRVFLSADSERFALAVAGLLARKPVAALPYVVALAQAARRVPRRDRALVAGARIAADAVALASLVHGSAETRTFVL